MGDVVVPLGLAGFVVAFLVMICLLLPTERAHTPQRPTRLYSLESDVRHDA